MMQTYAIAIYDRDEMVLEEFEQRAVNLRVALEVSTVRLGSLSAGHGQVATHATVDLVSDAERPDFSQVSDACPFDV